MPCKDDELACLLEHRPTLRGARDGDPPRPRRNSRSPSSRRIRSARNTVFVFTTPSTAARSRAGGRRSPGFASSSAMARRISAATCSWRASRSETSTFLTALMMLCSIASKGNDPHGRDGDQANGRWTSHPARSLAGPARRRAGRFDRGSHQRGATPTAAALGVLGARNPRRRGARHRPRGRLTAANEYWPWPDDRLAGRRRCVPRPGREGLCRAVAAEVQRAVRNRAEVGPWTRRRGPALQEALGLPLYSFGHRHPRQRNYLVGLR